MKISFEKISKCTKHHKYTESQMGTLTRQTTTLLMNGANAASSITAYIQRLISMRDMTS